MGKKRLNPECFTELNHFSGVLPFHHNEVACHDASQQRRKVIAEMRRVLQDLEKIPKCQEWDTSDTTKDTPGPHKFGEFKQVNGKPWDPHRVKSFELVASQFTPTCACIKRNGLQDDCRMTQCRGKGWCLTEPWPSCAPFTKVPGEWRDPDPSEMCPNVRRGKLFANGNGGGFSPDSQDECCYQMCNPCAPPCLPRELYIGNQNDAYRLERVDGYEQPMFKVNPC